MTITRLTTKRFARQAAAILVAVGMAVSLSGCVVYPVGYYHPHRHYYYPY